MLYCNKHFSTFWNETPLRHICLRPILKGKSWILLDIGYRFDYRGLLFVLGFRWAFMDINFQYLDWIVECSIHSSGKRLEAGSAEFVGFFFFPAFSSGSFCIDIYDFVVGYNVSSWPRTRMFLLFLLFLLLVELDECVSWRKRGFSTSVRVLATTCAFDRSFLLAVHFPIRCWPDFKSPTSSVTNDLERNDVASSIVIIAQWQSCFNFGK